MKTRRRVVGLAMAVVLLLLVLAGCTQADDTRQYIHTIGAVFTNDVNNTFDELYVYPSDEPDERGPNFIDKRYGITRVGSYGVTVEEKESYSVLVRDSYGGVYSFAQVPLTNAAEAVITFDDELLLTVNHRTGEVDGIIGNYVPPGDAPSRVGEPYKDKTSYQFDIVNETEMNITFISMREADAQSKGEVELYIQTLEPGRTAGVSGRLFEDDQDILEWVLFVQAEDGTSGKSTEVFYPWTIEKIIVTWDAEKEEFQFEMIDPTASSLSGSQAGVSSVADSSAAGGSSVSSAA